MTNDEKNICCEFEAKVLLYSDNDLSIERKEFWKEHLENCTRCSNRLNEMDHLSKHSQEVLIEDILDAKFDRMIEAAVNQKRSKLFNLFFPQQNEKRKIALALKVSVVSVLTVMAIVISLITNRPNSVKSISNDLLDWEGTKVNMQINDIKAKIDLMNDNNWEKQMMLLDQNIKRLEIKSDKFSFN